MSISSTMPTTGNPQTSLGDATTQKMGKEDFLKLLVAQLSHQDPLKPQEGAEFVAELAQFSNLEQAMSTNSKLDQLGALSSLSQDSQAMTLVGKTVTFDTSTVRVEQLSASPIRFTLSQPSSATTAQIVDAGGKVVRTVNLGALGAGAQSMTFDGIDDSGVRLAQGTYALRVKSTDAEGRTVTAETSHKAKVDAVVRANGRTELEVSGSRVSLSDVTRVQ